MKKFKKFFSVIASIAVIASAITGLSIGASAENSGDNGNAHLTYRAEVTPVASVGTGTGLKSGDQVEYKVYIDADEEADIYKLYAVELYASYNTNYFSPSNVVDTDDYAGWFDPNITGRAAEGLITIANGVSGYAQAADFANGALILDVILNVTNDVDTDQYFRVNNSGLYNYARIDYATKRNNSTAATRVEYYMTEAKGANATGEWYVLTNVDATLTAGAPTPSVSWVDATQVLVDGNALIAADEFVEDQSKAVAYYVTLTGSGSAEAYVTWKATFNTATKKGEYGFRAPVTFDGEGSARYGVIIKGVTAAADVSDVQAAWGDQTPSAE